MKQNYKEFKQLFNFIIKLKMTKWTINITILLICLKIFEKYKITFNDWFILFPIIIFFLTLIIMTLYGSGKRN